MFPPDILRAANNIIQQGLDLRRDQNLLIFADSSSLAVAEAVAGAAADNDVFATILFASKLIQSRFGPHESLPLPVEAAIREADAVLSCLSDRAETMAYRRRVLRTSWGRRTRLAHAPGMTLDILRANDCDFDLIRRHCHALALALVLGRELEIVTQDWQGRLYHLLVPLPGWEFAPAIGDGVIPDGAWANLPPGETFIVPSGGTGQVLINGSVPGRVLSAGEELVLTFRDGRLTNMQPKDSPVARHLYDTQIAYAEQHDDRYWSNLAEIGFGVNPSIERLQGIELLDEKKAGTVHVALGDSAGLGGKVESAIHCDLVTERPTVRVDGRLLLEAGAWRVEEADWLPDHRSLSLPVGWWDSVREIRRSGVRAGRAGDQLVRQWNSGPGRWDSTPVGTPATARLAGRLYGLLPQQGERISRTDLLATAERLGLVEETIPPLLWVLRQYDLARLPGELVL